MPSSFRAGIPSELEAIDRKALALDPGDRFPSAAAMADAIEGWLAAARPRLPPARVPRRAPVPRARRRSGASVRAWRQRPQGRGRCGRLGHGRGRRGPLEPGAVPYPPMHTPANAAVADPARTAGQPLRLGRRRPESHGDQPVGLDRRPARPGDPGRRRTSSSSGCSPGRPPPRPGRRPELRRPAPRPTPRPRPPTTALTIVPTAVREEQRPARRNDRRPGPGGGDLGRAPVPRSTSRSRPARRWSPSRR